MRSRRWLLLLPLVAAAAWAAWGLPRHAPAPADVGDRAPPEERAEPTLLVGRTPAVPEPAGAPVAPPRVTPPGPAASPGYEGFSPPVRYELFDAETGLSIPTPEGMLTEIAVAQESGPWYDGCGWVIPIPGYVLWDGSAWGAEFVPGVREARAVVPLRREVRVTAQFDLPTAGPRPDALLVYWSLGSFQTDPWEVRPPRSDLALEGVPFLRGEVLKVFVALRQGTWEGGATGPYGLSEVPLPEDPRTPIAVTVTVPPLPEGPPGSEAESVTDSNEVDRDVPWEEALDSSPAPPSGTGDVLVRARRRAGAPVPKDTLLHLGTWAARTDEAGNARFEGVYAGERVLTMRARGIVPVSKTVVVVAGTTTTVDLVEPMGASLDVAVVDGDGRPLPAARVTLRQGSGLPWTDVEDGVQRIDPFTDFRGRRLFSRVEPGRVVLQVSYGSRLASEGVEVGDGETRGVTVVLR